MISYDWMILKYSHYSLHRFSLLTVKAVLNAMHQFRKYRVSRNLAQIFLFVLIKEICGYFQLNQIYRRIRY